MLPWLRNFSSFAQLPLLFLWRNNFHWWFIRFAYKITVLTRSNYYDIFYLASSLAIFINNVTSQWLTKHKVSFKCTLTVHLVHAPSFTGYRVANLFVFTFYVHFVLFYLLYVLCCVCLFSHVLSFCLDYILYILRILAPLITLSKVISITSCPINLLRYVSAFNWLYGYAFLPNIPFLVNCDFLDFKIVCYIILYYFIDRINLRGFMSLRKSVNPTSSINTYSNPDTER